MYGYKIENGTIVVVEDEAAIIRSIFKNYLSGMSMRKAADATGVDFPHSTVKKIIRQKRYIEALLYLYFMSGILSCDYRKGCIRKSQR